MTTVAKGRCTSLLGAVESVAIGRMFALKHGYRLDSNRELLALAAAYQAATDWHLRRPADPAPAAAARAVAARPRLTAEEVEQLTQ